MCGCDYRSCGMALAVRQSNEKEISHQMKKFMSIMLALALTVGVASITVAQDAPKDDTKKTAKKGKGKKGKGDTKGDAKSGDAKGKAKAKKGKDDSTTPPAK
jgi:hypothetical protein